MANREEFEERVEKITADFDGQEVPRPPFWSGFRVVPSEIEFWQEGNFRMHHRAFYKKDKLHNGWELSILYP
jgi:pyridoxamine 5'-phosphate oxidase